ncbi:hypothetical protein ACLHDF_02545 [Priestia aryabhattai]|uniref:hypothetical protein n=1 Tax=Priestia megaterium TaxID=1404 RepID=UPI0039B903B1
MYWYKGQSASETMVYMNLKKRIRAEQEELKPLSKEEFIDIRNQFSNMLNPFIFPNKAIKSAYAYEPEWNDKFFVMETDEIYFGVYWFTTA